MDLEKTIENLRKSKKYPFNLGKSEFKISFLNKEYLKINSLDILRNNSNFLVSDNRLKTIKETIYLNLSEIRFNKYNGVNGVRCYFTLFGNKYFINPSYDHNKELYYEIK